MNDERRKELNKLIERNGIKDILTYQEFVQEINNWMFATKFEKYKKWTIEEVANMDDQKIFEIVEDKCYLWFDNCSEESSLIVF